MNIDVPNKIYITLPIPQFGFYVNPINEIPIIINKKIPYHNDKQIKDLLEDCPLCNIKKKQFCNNKCKNKY